METRKDKRNYSRIPTLKQVRCTIAREERPDETLDVVLKDLSPAGVSFESKEEFQVGALLQLQIIFPLATTQEPGKVQGKVVRCQRNEKAKGYDIGVAYVRTP